MADLYHSLCGNGSATPKFEEFFTQRTIIAAGCDTSHNEGRVGHHPAAAAAAGTIPGFDGGRTQEVPAVPAQGGLLREPYPDLHLKIAKREWAAVRSTGRSSSICQKVQLRWRREIPNGKNKR